MHTGLFSLQSLTPGPCSVFIWSQPECSSCSSDRISHHCKYLFWLQFVFSAPLRCVVCAICINICCCHHSRIFAKAHLVHASRSHKRFDSSLQCSFLLQNYFWIIFADRNLYKTQRLLGLFDWTYWKPLLWSGILLEQIGQILSIGKE